jgi:hypothetical protein
MLQRVGWKPICVLVLCIGNLCQAQQIRFPSTVPMSDLTQTQNLNGMPASGVRPISPTSVSPFPPGAAGPTVPSGTPVYGTPPGMVGAPAGSAMPPGNIAAPTAYGAPNPYGTGVPITNTPPPFDPYQGGNAVYNPGAVPGNQQTLASWLGMQNSSLGSWFGGTPTAPYGTNPYSTNPYGTNPYGMAPNNAPNPYGAAVPYGTPIVNGVPVQGGPGVYPNPTYGSNPYPSSIYPQNGGAAGAYPPAMYPNQSPQALFPNGWSTDNSTLQSVQRFCLGPRFRHTWVTRDGSADSLGINDTDVSIAFQIPNFFHSGQPLYILPSFGLHLWDGPNAITGADLPAQAYSAFGDFGWESDPNQIIGADLGARIGVFTDFETMNTDSVRYMGKALAKIRITPTMLFRLGVVYADRNKVKILPAGGLLWQPNPNVRWDIFFPEPKLSSYLTTVGKTDWWWYINGYYGGGSWTIKRDDGTNDRIDIDDLRVMVGFEWGQNELLRTGRRIGFVEAGYVFDRKITYVVTPTDDIDLEEGWVIRAGLAY